VPSLEQILTAPDVRPKVVSRCARLIDEEVGRKSGISGMAIKAAYKLVQKIKPSMVSDVTDRLLPDFARSLDPIFQESVEEAEGSDASLADVFRTHVDRDADRAADALLGVTDAKIDVARPAIKKAYSKLRGSAKGHVEQAVPGLARAIGEFV
jgi:hypothetical protein